MLSNALMRLASVVQPNWHRVHFPCMEILTFHDKHYRKRQGEGGDQIVEKKKKTDCNLSQYRTVDLHVIVIRRWFETPSGSGLMPRKKKQTNNHYLIAIVAPYITSAHIGRCIFISPRGLCHPNFLLRSSREGYKIAGDYMDTIGFSVEVSPRQPETNNGEKNICHQGEMWARAETWPGFVLRAGSVR